MTNLMALSSLMGLLVVITTCSATSVSRLSAWRSFIFGARCTSFKCLIYVLNLNNWYICTKVAVYYSFIYLFIDMFILFICIFPSMCLLSFCTNRLLHEFYWTLNCACSCRLLGLALILNESQCYIVYLVRLWIRFSYSYPCHGKNDWIDIKLHFPFDWEDYRYQDLVWWSWIAQGVWTSGC